MKTIVSITPDQVLALVKNLRERGEDDLAFEVLEDVVSCTGMTADKTLREYMSERFPERGT